MQLTVFIQNKLFYDKNSLKILSNINKLAQTETDYKDAFTILH